MIEWINQILVFIINIALVVGICFLVYFYVKLVRIDSKIEKIYLKFEKDRNSLRGQGRGITIGVINGQIEKLEREKNELTAPLERDRQRIISKIPFVK